MRCHMQNGYGIYMRMPMPLQQDIQFEKLRFRHHEELSQRVYEMMEGGERIYPHEVLNLLFLGGTFLIALLTYVDRHNKRK